MLILVTHSDLYDLSVSARDEIIGLLLRRPAGEALPEVVVSEPDERYHGISMDDVADLTPSHLREFQKEAAPSTMFGLRIFAEDGPVLSKEQLLARLAMELRTFLAATTKRARTVTGNKNVRLIGYRGPHTDDDNRVYAVSLTTYRSLRRFYLLDRP